MIEIYYSLTCVDSTKLYFSTGKKVVDMQDLYIENKVLFFIRVHE